MKIVRYTLDLQVMMEFCGLNQMGDNSLPKAGFPVASLARNVALLNRNGFGVVGVGGAQVVHGCMLVMAILPLPHLATPQAISSPSVYNSLCKAWFRAGCWIVRAPCCGPPCRVIQYLMDAADCQPLLAVAWRSPCPLLHPRHTRSGTAATPSTHACMQVAWKQENTGGQTPVTRVVELISTQVTDCPLHVWLYGWLWVHGGARPDMV